MIQIHTSDQWIWIREAKKHAGPDPQHGGWIRLSLWNCNCYIFLLFLKKSIELRKSAASFNQYLQHFFTCKKKKFMYGTKYADEMGWGEGGDDDAYSLRSFLRLAKRPRWDD